MPTYLCHGFRWHRKTVRYYIARHDIEDGATEWIVAPRSEAAIIEHFYSAYNFLPPVNPPSRNGPSPSFRKHHHAPSNDSSYVSRTSSSEYHGSEDQSYSNGNGNGAKARSRSASRRSSKSLSRPRTSGRDETTNSIPFPPLPLLSPSSIATKHSNYFDNTPPIKLLEEFDPKDESMASAPWAYVADYVIRVGTSVSIADEMFRYESRMKRDPNRAMHGPSDEYGRKVFGASSKKAGWLEKLRDQLQRGESIRWYVVVCGDEERDNPTGHEEEGEILEEEEEYEEEECEGSSARSQDRTWLRQSQSTQSTEATTATNLSVIEGGFEYRIPELAGLAMGTPTVTPERKKNKFVAPPLPQKEFSAMPSPPPPKSPLPPEVGNKLGRLSPAGLRSARSTIGLRKLFSRRKSETSV
ncbi:hypothetical protein O1611_g3607 [Lasiodiplodia mahajangana]|uniref:Uncharacterized protein n=1 Tax=Lasiodiplodia mahajangana TaxID=1108764 RepID=A0ACC2JRG8_9PEZI|nr:hypothetical protein O1611_g3607 [Lasiodiplodia mahajangana]